MAEAVLKVLLDNLASLIGKEISLIMGVDKEMQKLSSTLTAVKAVLEDAEMKQWDSKEISDWLCKLTNITYDVDDILDEYSTEVSKLEHKNTISSRYGLKRILFKRKFILLFKRKIGRRMKEAAEKLDAIAEERAKFHFREAGTEGKNNRAATRETGATLNESHLVYGRDKEKDEIVDILVNQVKDCEQAPVLPIVGVAGLGKTTLARLVFNDKRVVEHFGTKIWVWVPDNFDLKTLIKAMIESATGSGSASDLTSLDALECKLSQLLNQKRYVLVLDDVWNEDQEKWDRLRNVISCGSRGAAIIVTTRLKKVADIMGTLSTHYLAALSQDACLLLFKERAFGNEKEEHHNLESIGKQIVQKCSGVPLAAKTLGGLLRFKRTEKEWLHVQDSEIWNLPQGETSLLPALRLSYLHLPIELKSCFAYCAVFPKGSEIVKEDLIFLWMAHGYVSSNGILEEEDVGNEIWNELILRSLFEYVREDNRETIFTMHDLVHDLAKSVMENKVRGIQGNGNNERTSESRIRQVNLRTHHVAFPSRIQQMDLSFILRDLCSLRMLDASWKNITKLPSAVSNLKHLRYVNLSYTKIRTLPNAVCGLWNLKILNLNRCENLVRLPRNTRYLKNMRHLLLEECYSLREMPPKIGELRSLKTLSLFVVGHGKGNQPSELQFLNLKDELMIHHLERVKNEMNAKKANLCEKGDLCFLRLKWEGKNRSRLSENLEEEVLEALGPHPNLKKLEINGFNGRRIPRWLRNPSLVNLVGFYLKHCPNCASLPQMGELPHLKVMRLWSLAVEYVDEDEVENGNPSMTKFPSLEELVIGCLPSLKGFTKDKSIVIFPRLQKLDIIECSALVLPPVLPPLKHLGLSEGSKLTALSKPEDLISLDVRDGNIPNEVLENLTSLQSLTIYEAHENSLPETGVRGLKSLERLYIGSSKTLTCLPNGWSPHLTNLKTLDISMCPEFVELPGNIRYLTSLTFLYLSYLPKMVSLPESIKHLPSLSFLQLENLPQLAALPAWLGSFISLHYMKIWRCPKLKSLPDSIREMGNLQALWITECPILQRRCVRETGDDWHKIAHIPHVNLD